MKIISWNVNSVRARITNILDYIKQSNPDILLLQEIKTQDISFPYEDFKSIGYNSYVFGQKSYNGVAIISKHELEKINYSFIKDDANLLGHLLFVGSKIAKSKNLTNWRTVINTGAESGQTVFHLHIHFLSGRKLNWPPG